MVCESWKAQLDAYLDGELPEAEMRALDAHVPTCPSCSAAVLARVQMMRAIQTAGKRYRPTPEFRNRMQHTITRKPQRSVRLGWMLAAAAVAILLVGALTAIYMAMRGNSDHLYSEIADLHVATLASSSPVDVVSTDRHTVKPWFQGRIPFSFNLPELQNSPFILQGGRMAYLDQTPGAQLIYDVRKHHISVFIFPQAQLRANLNDSSFPAKDLPFNMETWTKGGLHYFVIGDASPADINSLATLFKAE